MNEHDQNRADSIEESLELLIAHDFDSGLTIHKQDDSAQRPAYVRTALLFWSCGIVLCHVRLRGHP